jgi:hypothetical protein
MEVIERTAARLILSISDDELLIVNNALNEVCNALPRASFETRMGATLSDVRSLLDSVNTLLPPLAE